MGNKENQGRRIWKSTFPYRQRVLNFLTEKLGEMADVKAARAATCKEFHIKKVALEEILEHENGTGGKAKDVPVNVETVKGQARQEAYDWRQEHKELADKGIRVGMEAMLGDPEKFAPELVAKGVAIKKGLGEYNADGQTGSVAFIFGNMPSDVRAKFFGPDGKELPEGTVDVKQG